MSDFSDYLLSQASSDAGASFSSNAPRPYVSGVSQNVLGGSVNVGSHQQAVDTELLSHPGGTHGKSLAGHDTVSDSVSVQQAAMSLYGMSRDEIRALQDQLVSAGYMSQRDVSTPGLVDGATAKAYGDLLQDTSAYNAAGNPVTIGGLLGQRGTARAAVGLGDTGTTNGRVQQLTPGLDLETQAQQVAASRYGRKLRPSELQKFVTIYHGLEGAQNASLLTADTAAQAGKNTTVTGASSVGAAATSYLDTLHPAEAAAHDVAGQFGNLLDLLRGI
jgi:hypothetical protein